IRDFHVTGVQTCALPILSWRFAPNWTSTSTLAWVYGENDSENRALGQMPAPELRLGLNYERGAWSAGGLLRGVSKQSRVAVNQGERKSVVQGKGGAVGGR